MASDWTLKRTKCAGGTLGDEVELNMATKKQSKISKKKSKVIKKVTTAKKVVPKKKVKKSVRSSVKPVAKKNLTKLMAAPKASKKKASAKKAAKRKIRGKADMADLVTYGNSRLGAGTGGQSGDTQGLSGAAQTNSESVKELLEEGQSYEAEVVGGVESVPDADEGEMKTHEVLEDDVPEEYLEKD